jgi:phage-related protein/predicted XRE-type DNA-binding protein
MTFVFAGTSLDDLRAFPDDARRRAGYQLQRLGDGFAADDWHPLPAMGEGAGELRIDLVRGVRRRVFAQMRGNLLVVLHGFQERVGPAAAADATLARRRLLGLAPERLRQWDDIWEAIEGTREMAANLRLRAELLNEVQAMLEMQDRSEPQLAKLLAIPEDRVIEVQRGMIDRCDLDGLVHMLAAAGYGIEIRLRPPRRSR